MIVGQLVIQRVNEYRASVSPSTYLDIFHRNRCSFGMSGPREIKRKIHQHGVLRLMTSTLRFLFHRQPLNHRYPLCKLLQVERDVLFGPPGQKKKKRSSFDE